MAEIGSWNGYKFEVSADVIRGFTGLSVTAGSETEDKTSSGAKYVSRKNAKVSQVSMTINLNAFTGVDVREDVNLWLNASIYGQSDYLYVSGSKLLPHKLMLTQAQVDNITMTNSGIWTSASVKVTFQQAEKTGSTSSSGKSGKSGKSSSSKKKASVKTGNTGGSSDTTSIVDKVRAAVIAVKNAVSTANKQTTAKKFISATGSKITRIAK